MDGKSERTRSNPFQILHNCLFRTIHHDLRESGGDRLRPTTHHRAGGEAAFGGRGSAGPQHCMTDDCDAEERALTFTWSTVKRFLCTFHIGQAAWRWLRDANNGVSVDERQELTSKLMKLVSSGSAESFDGRS